MKYNNLRAFEKHLEEAAAVRFSSVYLIIAKDSFERRSAVETLLKHLLRGKKNPELSVQSFDDEHLDIPRLLDELLTSTLFSERKVVAVKLADTASAPLRTALEERLEKIVPETILILSMASINHNTNFYKRLEKIGVVLDIPEMKSWEREKMLHEWVISKLAPTGKSMQQNACQWLVKQVEGDLACLHNELEKLLCYVGERTVITIEDVNAICTNSGFESVWQLGEATFRRDAASALRITKALLREENNLIGFLRQLRSQFQTEYQVCSILASGGNSQQVSQQFPYMRGNILDRHITHAQAYGMPSFKKGMQQIDETELKAKNSSTDNELLAEMLLVKLVGNK